LRRERRREFLKLLTLEQRYEILTRKYAGLRIKFARERRFLRALLKRCRKHLRVLRGKLFRVNKHRAHKKFLKKHHKKHGKKHHKKHGKKHHKKHGKKHHKKHHKKHGKKHHKRHHKKHGKKHHKRHHRHHRHGKHHRRHRRHHKKNGKKNNCSITRTNKQLTRSSSNTNKKFKC